MKKERVAYILAVKEFCKCYAKIACVKAKLEYGEVVMNISDLTSLLQDLETYSYDLLHCKEQLGYEDSFDFTQDDLFDGFEIKDGGLVGDYKNLYNIAGSWIWKFIHNRSNNHFLFEVGTLLWALNQEEEKK